MARVLTTTRSDETSIYPNGDEVLLSIVLCTCGHHEQAQPSAYGYVPSPRTECLIGTEKITDTAYPHLPPRPDAALDLSRCKGRYILFLRPGDRLLPSFDTKLPAFLENEPDIVFLTSYGSDECTWLHPAEKFKATDRITAIAYANLEPWCKLFRASLLRHHHANGFVPAHPGTRMVLDAFIRSNTFHEITLPLLIHPTQKPAQTPLHTYDAYARAVAGSAANIPGIFSKELSYSVRNHLVRRLFLDGFTQAGTSSFLSALRMFAHMLGQGRKLSISCGLECTARGFLSALSQHYRNSLENKQRDIRNRYLQKQEKKLRQQPIINILFIAISPSYWKSDSLLRAMMNHPRFNPQVLIVPEMQLTSPQLRRKQMDETRAFMKSQGFPTFELCDEQGNGAAKGIPEEYHILVYPKPYLSAVPHQLNFPMHRDRLWLFINYAFHSSIPPLFYDLEYKEFSWLDCYENSSCAEQGQIPYIGRRNNIISTGLPISDTFLYTDTPHPSPWKPLPGKLKKVIWAPHWTIKPGIFYLSHFLEIAERMRELTRETIHSIQWAFKPHPLLYNSLCDHPEWGKERTDAYYAWWANSENTQLETGDYVGLFMNSDAMVHDCCSFSNDYHFTGKPVLFLARDLYLHTAMGSLMLRDAIEAQYIGKGMKDIERFINDTVLGGNDPMRARREAFREQYLIPPHGRTAAENIIEYILTGKLGDKEEQ